MLTTELGETLFEKKDITEKLLDNITLDLYDKGIAVGDESMSFHPDDNIKRSEAAAIISRILFYDMRIELAKG